MFAVENRSGTMINFECQHCGLRVSFADHWAGKQAACPHCQKQLTVPGSDESDLDALELTPSEHDPTSKTDILPAQGQNVASASQAAQQAGRTDSWLRTHKLKKMAARKQRKFPTAIVATIIAVLLGIAVILLLCLR